MSPTLLGIQVGKVHSYGSESASLTHDKPWTTGFFKSPVQGPIFASETHLDGDAQADLKNHGGPDKAILAYSADHYPLWTHELGPQLPPNFSFGAFGENLTIAGLNESSVHIGDIYAIGDLLLEVSQPRQPCWKLARRWRMNELVPMVINNGRTGWYLRVLRPGFLKPGMPVHLRERINPDWPIAEANRILHHHKKDLDRTLRLAHVPRLADAWVNELLDRAARLRTTTPV